MPLDESWELSSNGEAVAGRAGFGVTTAYDVAAAGTAELRYQSPASRTTWLFVLGGLWIAALVASSRVRVPARLRPARPAGETLIDLDTEAQSAAAPDRSHVSVVDADDRSEFGWVEELLTDEEAQRHRARGLATMNWRRLPILILFVAALAGARRRRPRGRDADAAGVLHDQRPLDAGRAGARAG